MHGWVCPNYVTDIVCSWPPLIIRLSYDYLHSSIADSLPKEANSLPLFTIKWTKVWNMWPDLRKHSVCNPHMIRAMRVFSISDPNMLKSIFFISMSNNPSSNCSCRLQRLVVSYKGEISLHFDPPSLYSCRVRSPLLREIIRIRARGLSSYS